MSFEMQEPRFIREVKKNLIQIKKELSIRQKIPD